MMQEVLLVYADVFETKKNSFFWPEMLFNILKIEELVLNGFDICFVKSFIQFTGSNSHLRLNLKQWRH